MAQLSTRNDTRRPDMSRARILKNLTVICLGFLLLFTYQALANLQSTLNMEENLGLASQSVVYASLIVSALFLPKLVIRRLGCKLTLVLCILTYAPYVAANAYPRFGTLIPSAILLGLGAAPLWSAKCTYINEISGMYARQSSDTADVVTSRFFGVFFMVFQTTHVWGNMVSSIVFRPPQTTNGSELHINSSASSFWFDSNLTTDSPLNVTCGVNFLEESSGHLEPPQIGSRYMLVGIYLAGIFAASVTVALFLDPLKRQPEEAGYDVGVLSRAAATLKHMRNTQQLLLVPLTVFSGIEQAFIVGEFSKAYVACRWGLHSVGLVFICFGVINTAMSVSVGRAVKHIPRKLVMAAGAAGNTGACVALLLWEPTEDADFVNAFFIVGVWGFSDAVWQTQINALYGVLFRSQEEAAFGNYRLWESLGFCLAFATSSSFSVACKIYILLGFLLTGMTGYMAVETMTRKTPTTAANCELLERLR